MDKDKNLIIKRANKIAQNKGIELSSITPEIAAGLKNWPRGYFDIPREEVEDFLAPLPENFEEILQNAGFQKVIRKGQITGAIISTMFGGDAQTQQTVEFECWEKTEVLSCHAGRWQEKTQQIKPLALNQTPMDDFDEIFVEKVRKTLNYWKI